MKRWCRWAVSFVVGVGAFATARAYKEVAPPEKVVLPESRGLAGSDQRGGWVCRGTGRR